MKLPNFFIVGAPKCGTTALYEYLRVHPQVYMRVKEPHYFAFDLPGYRNVSDWDEYQALFRDAPASALAVGDISVYYLYSNVAIARLYQKFPSARILVLLRNPFDLAVSMHAQALRSRNESVTSFAKAWALCGDRRAGQGIPRSCTDVATLYYDRIPLLGSQLQRVFDTCPRQQVRWWFYEDFATDPRHVYLEMLAFLGLDDDGRTEFPRHNPRRRARSQIVAQFTQKTPELVTWAVRQFKRATGIKQLGIIDALQRANWVPAGKAQLPPELLDDMRAVFEPDIHLLESLTGRNLDHWLHDMASDAH
ncbi:MAG TPA: sulfotransferase [Rhodanobacteraceae bacterium]|nr:sulfotransferase [Rhodanobacteraceae bacterium]